MTTHQMARHQRDRAFGGFGPRVLAGAGPGAGDVHGATPDGTMVVFGGLFAVFWLYLVVQGYPRVARRHRQRPAPTTSTT